MAVGNVQVAGKKRGGVPGCCLLFSSFFHGLGWGRGGWLDRGTVQKHGDSAGASKNSAATVNSIWFDFSLPVFDEMPARV
jgi:hypothetical protein